MNLFLKNFLRVFIIVISWSSWTMEKNDNKNVPLDNSETCIIFKKLGSNGKSNEDIQCLECGFRHNDIEEHVMHLVETHQAQIDMTTAYSSGRGFTIWKILYHLPLNNK